MKQLLITLSTLITLTLITNSINNTNNTNIAFINNKVAITDATTTLINNQYQYLSSNDWITNQSTIDHKFYSYDTSNANYLLSDGKTVARTLFIVDNNGNLTYKKDIIIPAKDKIDVNNTKQEMIATRKIVIIKDDYDPYSKSEYSHKYFNGDNNDWQYLQQGGVEKDIDISQQTGGNKVENCNNLNETLGLYYIAKAAHENKISQVVANNLGQYFISKTSLKGQISNELTTTIINLIINNKNIYNFLSKASIKIIAKNYSLNWILDSNNKLVAIYYHQFNKANIENSLNYKWNDSYSWFGSDNSNQYTLLKWIDYVHNWDTFTSLYPTFNFNNNSYLKLGLKGDHDANINFPSSEKTNKIKSKQCAGNSNSLYNLSLSYHFGRYSYHAYFDLNIWHDNSNIYFQWFLNYNGITTLDVKLNNAIFFNIMN